MAARSRGWCFTCNNYTDDDIARVMDVQCDYLIVGFEVGDEGTPHMQGYFYVKNKYRFFEAKRQLYPKFHIEIQKGTKIEALTYCMEDLDYWEKGKRPRQGHRSDLDVIHYELKSGVPVSQIAEDYFSRWVQYNRSFDKYSNMVRKFDTKLIAYVPGFKSMQEIYRDYGPIERAVPDRDAQRHGMSLLYTGSYYSESELFSIICSGYYKAVIIPTTPLPPREVKQLISHYIAGDVLSQEISSEIEFLSSESDETL